MVLIEVTGARHVCADTPSTGPYFWYLLHTRYTCNSSCIPGILQVLPLTMFTTVAAAMSSLVLLLLLMLVFPAVRSTCVSRLRQKYARRAGGAFCYLVEMFFFFCSLQHLIRLMILFLTTGNPSCLLPSRPLP